VAGRAQDAALLQAAVALDGLRQSGTR
jgi:hypothetical protein